MPNSLSKFLLFLFLLTAISSASQAQLNNAFGDNMKEVEPGVWAIFTGDVNQDNTVDASDFLLIDSDIQNFGSGYIVTDLNGDGSVDATDFLLVDFNIQNFVGAVTPGGVLRTASPSGNGKNSSASPSSQTK